jgi:hypothetical protein
MAGEDPRPGRVTTASDTTESDIVEISVPLRSEYGATLRTVAASLGADAGFTIDDLDDLRLALSEVFSVLVDLSRRPEARARVLFTRSASSITVVAAADELESPIELDELAASILGSVVDDHEVIASGIRFVKRVDADGDDPPRA